MLVAAGIVFDTVRAVGARRASAGEPPWRALATITRRNQRRYGGYVVHLGVVLIVIGLTVSMSYSVETEATLDPGESLDLGRYRLTFEGLRASEQPTHVRVEGVFRASRAGTELGLLTPALKYYPTQQSPIGRAEMRVSLVEDVYVILSGFSDVGRRQATLKLLVRPMVAWIWLGGLVLSLGTLVTVWPLRVAAPSRSGAAEVTRSPLEPVRD